MSMALPVDGFQWLTEAEMDSIRPNIITFVQSLGKGEGVGYMFELDLDIPEELHDKQNDYPAAPINRCVKAEELSKSYQNPLAADLELGTNVYQTPKLVADLYNKKNYIVHYSSLQQYIQMGCKISKIHKVLKFNESAWMKSFIDFNTAMRSKSTTEFEKSFWKLLNNRYESFSIRIFLCMHEKIVLSLYLCGMYFNILFCSSAFGKTIEQVRKRKRVNIVTSAEQAFKLTKKPTISNIISINETTSIFIMKQASVYLNKPIAVGTCIMELAKSIMYDMHYNCMQKFYGSRARLVYTDTGNILEHLAIDLMILYCFKLFDLRRIEYKLSYCFKLFNLRRTEFLLSYCFKLFNLRRTEFLLSYCFKLFDLRRTEFLLSYCFKLFDSRRMKCLLS